MNNPETETLFETVCRVLDYPAPPKESDAGKFYRPEKFSEPKAKRLTMRHYSISVVVIPPNHQIACGAKIERKRITIKGCTLEDAKRRAGIE